MRTSYTNGKPPRTNRACTEPACSSRTPRDEAHPLHALVLVVGGLLDAVGVGLEGGVAPGVVLLLLERRGGRADEGSQSGHDLP